MYNRPRQLKFEESEEELLKQQEEFYKKLAKNVVNPAAKLIKSENYHQHEEPKNETTQMEAIPNTNIVPEYVMGSIIERKIMSQSTITTKTRSKGFPQAFRRDKLSTSSDKRASVFSQEMARRKSARTSDTMDDDTTVQQDQKHQNETPEDSFIVSGPESKAIHQENLKLLSEMSPTEILEEKQSLLISMDPKLIAFIASKRKQTNFTMPSSIMEVEENVKEEDLTKEEDIPPVINEILSDSNSGKWLHFDKLEAEKYAWMKNIEAPVSTKSGDQYEARFDFQGWLQPFSMKDVPLNDKNRILYHHGNEEYRPGYTLEELMHLCRSTVSQQRILALNTIGNIISLYTMGVYDGILELPTEQIFFTLRIAIDENTIPILTSGLCALRKVFYYDVDELCVDNFMFYNCDLTQPILEYKIEDTDDKKQDGVSSSNDDLNDQQLSETNLIKCLLRTDILVRANYMLNTLNVPFDATYNIVLLLIRIVRDEEEICQQTVEFFEKNDLFTTFMSSILCTTVNYNSSTSALELKTMALTLKLLRLIMIRSKNFAINSVQKYNILSRLLFYLSNDAPSGEFVNLQTESFLAYATLLKWNVLDKEHIIELHSIITKHLMYHLNHTSASQYKSQTYRHICSILCVISNYTAFIFESNYFIQILQDCLCKWLTQLTTMNSFQCGNLLIISSIMRCFLNIKLRPFKSIDNALKRFLTSSSFSVITKDIEKSSNFLCTYKPHETLSALDSIQASIWNTSEHIIPILQTCSCLPFIASLSSFILEFYESDLILDFLQHEYIQSYLKIIYSSKQLNLISNWFTMIEAELLIKCLLLSLKVQKQLTETDRYFYYILCLKTIHVYRIEHKQVLGVILEKIIFSKSFIPNENLMRCLEIKSTIFTSCFQQIQSIKEYFIKYLGFETIPIKHNLILKNKQSGFLPTDWFYLPIIYQYSKQADHTDDELKISILRCLQTVCLFETLIPEISNILNVTDRYCRLACVFLCSTDIFLEIDVQNLLETCFKNIFKIECLNELNFHKKIQGLNNFEDFYISLLEQYQGVSYGNTLFGNVILLPLTQKNGNKWRKMVWSEYAGVIQILNLQLEQVMIPIDEFLYPVETDISLLKCYKRSLSFGHLKRSPFLRHVVEHHLQEYTKSVKTSK